MLLYTSNNAATNVDKAGPCGWVPDLVLSQPRHRSLNVRHTKPLVHSRKGSGFPTWLALAVAETLVISILNQAWAQYGEYCNILE
jgi:hypothetical protein